MQFPINPNMFNGGAVVFNSAPFLNLALQNEAKKRAKDDAIDKYLIDQSKAVTPTGMRAKDIEGGWSAKAQQWQELGIRGKKNIANPALDGYKTINEFNRLKNELLADAERSKQEGKDEDLLIKLRAEGKWNPTDEDLSIANDKSLSIYDKNRKNRGLNELSVNRPPFDPSKFITDVTAGRTRVKSVDKYELDPKSGLRTNYVSQGYAPEEVKSMADNAPFIMEKDPSAKIAFERMRENPEKLAELQRAYSSIYPNDLVDTNEKAAKAYAIMSVGGRTGQGREVVNYTDKNAEEARQMRLIDYRAKAQKSVNAAKAAATTTEAKSVLNEKMQDLWDEAQSHPVKTTSNKTGEETTYNITLDEDVAKAGMLPGEKFAPDALRFVVRDGKKYVQRIIYHKDYDEKGFLVGTTHHPKTKKPLIDTSKSTIIPYKQFRDRLGKGLFAGKILYNELGQPVQGDDNSIMNDDTPDRPTRPTKDELDLESIE